MQQIANKDFKEFNSSISDCHKSNLPCAGFWSCHFLTTPPPTRPEDKETTFVAVYREAKNKGILSCPSFIPSKIDGILDNMF